MDTPIFYIFLFIHLVSLIIGFGSVIIIDTFGLLWLLKKRTLAQVTIVANVTQRLIWIGWCGLVVSGLVLISYKGYIDNLTKIKLFFVLMLGLNGIFLHFIKKSLDKIRATDQVPKLIQFRMGMASAISQTGWWGAILIGFVHRHWRHNIPWPANPYLWVIIIVAIFSAVFLFGEIKLRKSK